MAGSRIVVHLHRCAPRRRRPSTAGRRCRSPGAALVRDVDDVRVRVVRGDEGERRRPEGDARRPADVTDPRRRLTPLPPAVGRLHDVDRVRLYSARTRCTRRRSRRQGRRQCRTPGYSTSQRYRRWRSPSAARTSSSVLGETLNMIGESRGVEVRARHRRSRAVAGRRRLDRPPPTSSVNVPRAGGARHREADRATVDDGRSRVREVRRVRG